MFVCFGFLVEWIHSSDVIAVVHNFEEQQTLICMENWTTFPVLPFCEHFISIAIHGAMPKCIFRLL